MCIRTVNSSMSVKMNSCNIYQMFVIKKTFSREPNLKRNSRHFKFNR